MQRRTLVTAVAAASLIVVPVTAGSAFGLTSGASSTTALTNSVPSSVLTHSGVGPTITGPARTTQRLDLALQLPLRNWARAQALTAKGTAVGAAAYARDFAPTKASVDRVVAWARHNGYQIDSVNRSGGAVNVSASIGRINSTLKAGVSAASFKGVSGVSATKAPVVPSSLGLSGITGLNTTIVVRPMHVTAPKAKAKPNASGPDACAYYWGQNVNPLAKAKFTYASNNICGYHPKDLASMYHVTGAGSYYAPKLGILLPYNSSSALSNVNHLMAANKYPQLSASNYHVTPASSYDTSQCGDIYGWYSEQTLDLTSTHEVAQKASIYYTAAKSCLFTDTLVAFQGAVSRHATATLSMSFGSSTDRASAIGQSVIDGWTKSAAQASLLGMSVYASTGDNGNNSASAGAVGVGFPSSDPYITAVGGTSEGITSTGASVVRTGWEDELEGGRTGFYAGANGGPSQTFKMPSWQTGKVPGSSPYRRLPDVAALADPFTGILLYTAHSGYTAIGGTSLASPTVAAMTGLAKSYNKRSFGLASPSLYKMIGTSAVNDITPHNAGVYYAGSGDQLVAFDTKPQTLQSATRWDNVTGVGVPNGTPFLAALGK